MSPIWRLKRLHEVTHWTYRRHINKLTYLPNYVNDVLWHAAQQCPSGYVEMSSRCLRAVSTPISWQGAQQDCRNTGGRLASVLSSTDPVMTAAGQISGATRVWIGLRKTRTDWQYATGIWFSILFHFLLLCLVNPHAHLQPIRQPMKSVFLLLLLLLLKLYSWYKTHTHIQW